MFSRKRAETVNSTASEPPPRVVDTTGNWRGNDGSWSTFYINIGDKNNNGGGQTFEVLPSTYYGIAIVPLQSDWCTNDCAANRGIGSVNGDQAQGFDISDSTTWKESGIYDINLPYWWMGNTSAPPGGYYGVDYVGIGKASSQSWVAKDMMVAGTTSEDFYIGQFGLGPGATNPGGGTGTPVDSILTYFNKTQVIPSLSYGYTAGAKYRKSGSGIVGSFVLGGYDEARLNMDNSVSINMPSAQNTSLVVGVQGISYRPNLNVEQNIKGITDANVKGFRATIDSTLPYLWLPKNVCDKFAEYFNLKYDNATNFYAVDSASGAQNNDQQDAVVTFKIGSDPSGSDANHASITLPYSAFDLEHFNKDNRDNATKYFPIRRSTNGMFVLGRTFLQEAYIITDYGRQNFTIAQVPDLDSMPESKLVTIHDPSYVAPSPTPIPTGGSKGLSGGAIAGIVIGILAVALGVALGIFIWWKKRRAQKNTPPTYKEATEIDTSAAGNEVKHRRVSELDTQAPGAPKSPAGGYYGGQGNDRKDLSPFPPISEMPSPDSLPPELYSPPLVAATPNSEGSGPDYFTVGGKLGRRGATRESSAANTPGTPPPFTPIAELPAGDVDSISSASNSPKLASGSISKRDPSATRSQSNIDEVMKREASPAPPGHNAATIDEGTEKAAHTEAAVAEGERRPSHTRGASDATVQSDTTVVSQPTPEELESWRTTEDEQPRRPLSE